MNLNGILSSFSPDVRESTSIRGLVVLVQTVLEQLQATKEQLQATNEQLIKSQEKIKTLEGEIARLRKTPKRPKFPPNNMQPRNRGGGSQEPSDNASPMASTSFVQKENSEVVIKASNLPDGSRFKGYQTFSVQDIGFVAKDITYKLEVWQAPSGEVIRATLPEELEGQYFGSTLRAFATHLYAEAMIM